MTLFCFSWFLFLKFFDKVNLLYKTSKQKRPFSFSNMITALRCNITTENYTGVLSPRLVFCFLRDALYVQFVYVRIKDLNNVQSSRIFCDSVFQSCYTCRLRRLNQNGNKKRVCDNGCKTRFFKFLFIFILGH